MARGKALQLGRYYHVFSRGDNRQNVFLEPRNYPYFLDLYARHVVPVTDTFAYCLMRNHFHLLIRVKSEDELINASPVTDRSTLGSRPTRAFQAFFTAYAQAINKAYQRSGRLFQQHFGRREVRSDADFASLVFYIHANPQRHGFVEDFRTWPWSSFVALAFNKASILRHDTVLDWFGGQDRLRDAHQAIVDDVRAAALWQSDGFD